MKLRKQPMFGRSVNLQVPETLEEFNLLAKAGPNENPALELAIDHVVYHGQLGKIRPLVVAELLKIREEEIKSAGSSTLPERKINSYIGEGDKKKPVYEKDTNYIKRVLSSKALTPDAFDAISQRVADGVPFNPAESEGGSTLAKKYYALADGITATVEAGQGTWEKFQQNFANMYPDFEFELEDGVPTRDSLAAAFKHDEQQTIKANQDKVKGFVA